MTFDVGTCIHFPSHWGTCIDIAQEGILQLGGRYYSFKHAIQCDSFRIVRNRYHIHVRRCRICLYGERKCAHTEFGGGVRDTARARKIYPMLHMSVVIESLDRYHLTFDFGFERLYIGRTNH